MKKAVLLINLGTPDNPSVSKVKKYLSEFLNDPRVIDISPIKRKLLVNCLIVPFRAKNSSRIYTKLWTTKGSPLLINSEKVREKLQELLGNKADVWLAMRYQKPSLKKVLMEMKNKNYHSIIFLPLFPQYASSSTGSAFEKLMQIISKWWVIPNLKFISQYYNNPGYISAVCENASVYSHKNYDHILFSYHGLPVRQVNKTHHNESCDKYKCTEEINSENQFCYQAVCYETSRLVSQKLEIPKKKYSVAFQSRLGKEPWLTPYADKLIIQKAKNGVKTILVFSLSFTVDCLETTIEIGEEYNELFRKHGGEKLQLVKSLNDNLRWIEFLKSMTCE